MLSNWYGLLQSKYLLLLLLLMFVCILLCECIYTAYVQGAVEDRRKCRLS